jgi:predicted MPP superfamily phosphohydrolase
MPALLSASFMIFGDLVWGVKTFLRVRRFPGPWRWVASAAVIAFAGLQLCGFALLIFGRGMDLPLESLFPKPLIALVYIWHCLILLPVICLWFVGQIVGRVRQFIRRRLGNRGQNTRAPAPTPEQPAMNRREFMAATMCAAPAFLALGATGVASWEWSEFRVRRLVVPLANLPPALDGFTITQISDLHVGVFTRGAILDRIVEAANQMHPHLVLLPGDLINYALGDLPVGLEVVKRLQAPHGVFMCEGNHDLFENPTAFRARTAAAGVRLLVNESAFFTVRDVPVQILGLPWGWGDHAPRSAGDRSDRSDEAISSSMERLLPQRKKDTFPILLAHHPHAFDYAWDIPLTLAGHTHGGQIMLTPQIGFGPALFRYWSGLYESDGRALVVSNGVGNWFPVRVGAPAELVHLTLRAV